MDMGSLMEQAKQLQSKVAAAQDKLAKTSIKGIAGNGQCIVEMSGKYDLLNLTISPELLKNDVTHLTQVIMDAFADAKSKADATIDKVMGDATAGMPLPE
ncbi:MAG TPA: YbaB/EbfC family nucleoid-associated protein [Alphaproteobacteria bacterium]|nr:YbaB/EbfC family nucleoid-associated protein [Alphaproteobacteria bacterium]